MKEQLESVEILPQLTLQWTLLGKGLNRLKLCSDISGLKFLLTPFRQIYLTISFDEGTSQRFCSSYKQLYCRTCLVNAKKGINSKCNNLISVDMKYDQLVTYNYLFIQRWQFQVKVYPISSLCFKCTAVIHQLISLFLFLCFLFLFFFLFCFWFFFVCFFFVLFLFLFLFCFCLFVLES